MRSLAVLLVLAALHDLPAQRDTQAAKTAPTTERQLIRNEDGWAAALVKRDAAFFQRMLAPGFVYTEDAKVMTRDDVLRDATSGPDTVTASHNEDMVVHPAGSVTA